MDVFVRKIAGIRHDDITVYTEAEAKARSIEYRHWREADVGTWAITDDGYVGYYYGRYDFPRRSSDVRQGKERFVAYFGFGNIMSSRKAPYFYEKRRATGRFQSDKSWSEALASQRLSKLSVKIYVATLLKDGRVDWGTLGKILGPNDRQPEWKARRIFKLKEFKKMVEDELDRVLKGKGIDKEFVIELYKRAIAVAESQDDAANMLKAAKELGELVGLAKNKVKTFQTFELTSAQTSQLDYDFKTAEKAMLKLTEKRDGETSDEE